MVLIGLVIFAAATDPFTVGGAVTILLILAGYFLRSYSQNAAGTWKIVREKEKENERLRWETRYWQFRAGIGEDPGPAPTTTIVEVENKRKDSGPEWWQQGPLSGWGDDNSWGDDNG